MCHFNTVVGTKKNATKLNTLLCATLLDKNSFSEHPRGLRLWRLVVPPTLAAFFDNSAVVF